jgi:hypothetical protein
MEEIKVTFETAKLAKEKGFDWEVNTVFRLEKLDLFDEYDASFCNYNNSSRSTSCPTQSFLQKWLREVHNINVEPRNSSAFNPTTRVFTPRKEYKCFVNFLNKTYEDFIETKYFCSYEEALEIGLQEGLKLISNEL